MGSGRHIEYIQYVLDNSTTNLTEIYDFVAHLIYTTTLYTCRLSGLFFYQRLCSQHTKLLLSIKFAFVFMTLAYIPQMLLIIFHCLPVTGLWSYAWQPEFPDYTCIDWSKVYVTNSGVSLVSDLVVFAIPAALISIFKGDKIMKLKLSLVLFPGIMYVLPLPPCPFSNFPSFSFVLVGYENILTDMDG